MRKPLVFRLAGWLALLLFLVIVSAWVFPPAGVSPEHVMGGQMFLFLLAVPLALLWAVASIAVWLLRRSAAEQATALSGTLLPTLTRPPLQVKHEQATPGQQVWDNPPTKIRCDVCGRFHALLYCGQHNKFLCFPCCAKHDQGGCQYIAAGRLVDEAHKQPENLAQAGMGFGL